MGEVYRAKDTKLKRDVAIKILPDEFSRDTDRVSRFQREAEVLASLTHPNMRLSRTFGKTGVSVAGPHWEKAQCFPACCVS